MIPNCKSSSWISKMESSLASLSAYLQFIVLRVSGCLRICSDFSPELATRR